MAKDNNNINITDELASGGGGSGGGAGSSSAETLKHQNRLAGGGGGEQLPLPDVNGRVNGQMMGGVGHSSSSGDAAAGSGEEGGRASLSQQQQQRDADVVGAIHELPRREENPFSFKHFLKRDSSLGAAGAASSTTNATTSATNINHSRSASSINNNGVVSSSTSAVSNPAVAAAAQPSTSGASPSKSATTSSLHNTSTTGAKPKIPQFQSVNTLSSESKMKRSPRFPSFDSQSSLSDLADDKFMANIYHSRSNNSFGSDYPLGGVGGGAGGGGSGSQQYVQRSYSNYDMESPGSVESPRLVGSQNLHNSPNFGGGRSRENLAGGHRLGASEFSAALPDFVQDHLVMEQWYNQMGSPKSGSPVSVDFDHLPDFAVNNLEPDASGRGHGSIINDMPFDLTAVAGPSSQSANRNRTPLRNTSPNVPLDLPPQNHDFSFDLPRRRTTPPHQPAPAPELPPDLTENNNSAAARSGYYRSSDNHSPPPTGCSAADKIHRLPDFLSDGPIHSSGRLADVTHDTPHFNSPDAEANSQQQRLQIERHENDRLRRELDDSRRIVAEQARRISELERALEVAKSSAHRVEGFEENLDKSYLRAATAESQVLSLRQKMKKMATDMEALRLENEMLKEEGAVGGAGAAAASSSSGACGGGPGPSGIRSGMGSRRGHPSSSSFSRAQELSRELRQAAASAENNLRQLLTGVDNLRMMASTIENIDRIDITSHPEDFLSDSDDDDLLGPAL